MKVTSNTERLFQVDIILSKEDILLIFLFNMGILSIYIIEGCAHMNNLNTKQMYLLGSCVQTIIAYAISKKQSREIKKNAKATKYIQLCFAAFVFMMGIIQTMTIINKMISVNKGN